MGFCFNDVPASHVGKKKSVSGVPAELRSIVPERYCPHWLGVNLFSGGRLLFFSSFLHSLSYSTFIIPIYLWNHNDIFN